MSARQEQHGNDAATKKTQVADIDRSVYDITNEDVANYKVKSGLTKEIVEDISRQKDEPSWMLEKRLHALAIYEDKQMPSWGPSLYELDMENIVTYVRPKTDLKGDWEEVPDDIKDTFDRLGIPKAERESLGGVGAQYDSEVVYHSIQNELTEQGVIYTDLETGVKEYESIVKENFGTLITPNDHKFAALHYAVWSGGSFVYVPPGVEVAFPLQSYFRLNAPGAGQFEHTLIVVDKGAKLHFIEGCSAPKYNVTNLHAGAVELFVREGASLRYSTIENWSRNMMNLNTKRCAVDKDGSIEWVSGTFGSHVTMLYPMSVLRGENARSEFTGISFASRGQYLDSGAKVVHAAPNTASTINSRSISKDGGVAVYRSAIVITPEAKGSKSSVSCESLMLDAQSRADTIPAMDIRTDEADVGHEAKIGRVSEEAIFYLTTRGLSEEEAKAMIVRGFVEPIAKELPLEYAVEINNLINLELEGSIG